MAVVRRVSSTNSIVRAKEPDKPSIRSTRQPSTLGEMGDTNFGTLDSSKDGLFVSYNNSSKLFELVSADRLLEIAVEDNDIADSFIEQLESELDLGQLAEDIDGGGF